MFRLRSASTRFLIQIKGLCCAPMFCCFHVGEAHFESALQARKEAAGEVL